MQRVSGGYTIIEVTIVLTISMVLVIMSMKFLSGRDGHIRFSQSMTDLQSKIQDWINDVPTGFAFGTAGTANCHLGGTSVIINQGARLDSDPPDCLFLGKAIQFADAPATSVYAYSVFGLRQNPPGDLVSSIKSASPVPAAGSAAGTGSADLTETYNLSGATLKNIPVSSGFPSHLAGFYLSLNTDQVIGQNGASNLKAFQYPTTDSAPDSPTVVKCIENKPPCGLVGLQTDPAPLTTWQMCFQSDSNGDTALLSIISSNGLGATTQLEFKAC